jgi:protein-L-isoaspartate(D-aspartate) O-methyltransferase
MDSGSKLRSPKGDSSSRPTGSRVDLERREMIQLLRDRGIADERLLAVMSAIDRRAFVQGAFVNRAYDDSALPIGSSQTISQPYTVGFMTEALHVQKGQKILEVGTGSGYQAAILAELGARVYTIERHIDLLTEARKRFDKFGYQIASKAGDGTIGWKEYAPYDGIIVTAGAPDVPQPLLDQLNEGGTLVIPIGGPDTQNLFIISRRGGAFESREVAGFKFVPLIGTKGWK